MPATIEKAGDVEAIAADRAYPLRLFLKLTGLSDAGRRAARRRGLQARKVGKRKFIRGSDWLDFLANVGE